MELRVLEYFLAVAREQNITAAAESLHLTQPTLSIQLKGLEDELGKQLLVRGTKGSRKVTLTEDGKLLRARAEEILNLVEKTENEISQPGDTVAGDVWIGTGETDTIRVFARAAKKLQKSCPDIHYHFMSGNASYVMEQLDKGLIDFGLVFSEPDAKKYDIIRIPKKEHWGVLMRRDDSLAEKIKIFPEDLMDLPLITSSQENATKQLAGWMHRPVSRLHIVATYNLILNAAILTDEGFGYTIGFDKLLDTVLDWGNSSLCFRPLSPMMEDEAFIIWKKYQIFSKAADRFLKQIREELIPTPVK
ncbi:MAG: LysR family transcriptional regulator [Eubacteriales bacterium]|jgi:DNA-binding transcriptional LysR family regulator